MSHKELASLNFIRTKFKFNTQARRSLFSRYIVR